jgi:ABC-type multidrug transport system ATPase subunit
MGPSGAGKTSFLDLVGRRVLSSDPAASVCSLWPIFIARILKDDILQITFDGQDFSMRELGSYVAQDDALHGYLTVKDNIRYSALLS